MKIVKELIERLRMMQSALGVDETCGEAADALERLTAERDAAIEGAAQEARYNNALRAEIVKNGEHLRYVEGQETLRCAEVRALEAERDDLGDDLAQAKRYIETLTAERDVAETLAEIDDAIGEKT
jgi:hypothetical protein